MLRSVITNPSKYNRSVHALELYRREQTKNMQNKKDNVQLNQYVCTVISGTHTHARIHTHMHTCARFLYMYVL